jgi:two-component sensor histidine kinase
MIVFANRLGKIDAKGVDIKKILRSRLPERLAGRLPSPLVELAVGVTVAGVFVLLRVAMTPLTGDRAPYAFVFLSIVLASVIAGWRSGLLALLIGQGLVWTLIAEGAFGAANPQNARLGGLIIATISQAIILFIITLYQREVEKGLRERERRLDLIDQARREIDHRTKNNFQTVLSLVQLQASREKDASVQGALTKVADRIAAISVATERLTMLGDELGTVRLRDHLCELCAQLERGLARGEVTVECDMADVTASADTAIHLAIIVNELVTNALKHAFGDGGTGRVQVSSRMIDGGLEIEVSDNGSGMKKKSPSAGTGLGRTLVESFARHLKASHETVSTDGGTTHRILIPQLH